MPLPYSNPNFRRSTFGYIQILTLLAQGLLYSTKDIRKILLLHIHHESPALIQTMVRVSTEMPESQAQLQKQSPRHSDSGRSIGIHAQAPSDGQTITSTRQSISSSSHSTTRTRRPDNNIIIPSDHPRKTRGRNRTTHFQSNSPLDIRAHKPRLAP